MQHDDPNEPTGDGTNPTPPNHGLDPPKKDYTAYIVIGIIIAVIAVILAA